MVNWNKPELVESDLQSDIIEFAHVRGWFCEKIESRSGRGIMDLICIRRGRHVWMEVKRDGEPPRPQQVKRARDMKSAGAEVYCIDTLEKARRILK
jgi:hypothetical protein